MPYITSERSGESRAWGRTVEGIELGLELKFGSEVA